MRIEELCNCLSEDSEAEIVDVQKINEDFIIQLEADSQDLLDVRNRYELRVVDVVESDVCPRWIGEIEFSDEHPLLWDYNCPWRDLYHTSLPTNRLQVLGALYEAHERIFGGWRPLASYLNSYVLTRMEKNGLLARGPEPLIDEYVAAIEGLLKTNTVPSHRKPKSKNVLVLGDSFVICSQVIVSELGTVSP